MALDRLGHFFSERFVILAARILCATLDDHRCDDCCATALLTISLGLRLGIILSCGCWLISNLWRLTSILPALLIPLYRLFDALGQRFLVFAAVLADDNVRHALLTLPFAFTLS